MTPTLPDFSTQRLLLKPRTLADLDAVAVLNADPQVMRYVTAVGAASMSREAVATRSFANLERGLGYWSVFAQEDGAFLGYVGLIPGEPPRHEPQFSYRFAATAWGRGFAQEALMPLLGYAFVTLRLPAIGLFTHPENDASLRLAARLGFRRLPEPAPETIGDPPIHGADFLLLQEDWRAGISPPPAA